MNDDIRPRGTVEVQCSAPNCSWRFWLAADHALLPDGPFFCDSCAEHARYEFVGSHRQAASEFLAELANGNSLLRTTLRLLGDQRVRVTIEKIIPGAN
jgi:hypothetical protein